MRREKYEITLLFFWIALLSVALAGCASERKTAAAAPETVSNLKVIAARVTEVPDWLEVVGTVRAAQTSQVSSQMMGNIVEIPVQEGDRVERGQILGILDDAQPRTAVEQAAASLAAAQNEVEAADTALALATTTLNRYRQLYEKKSVSPQEFDEVKTRYQSAEAERDMARAEQTQANAALIQAQTALGYTRIRAPFPGVVTHKLADTGTLASPGMPLFTIEDTRSFRLEVTVDEGDIDLVHTGETVPVTIDGLGDKSLSGRVTEIVPAADPASRSFLVKIGLPADALLRSGLFGSASFSRGERKALLLPRDSVVTRGQLQGVYVLGASQIAELRYVTLGKTFRDKVEVLSGLQSGEQFVIAPGGRELDGKRIAELP